MKTHQQALDIAGDYDNLSDQIQAYLKERGLVAVVEAPTIAMIVQGTKAIADTGVDDASYSDARKCYRAMLAAAPNPFEGEE